MTELDVIKKKIRDRLNDLADELAGGAAKDYAEYKHITGVIMGLAIAERDVLDIQKRNEED